MTEKLMQYCWEHRLWKPAAMTTNTGETVEVIDPGLRNSDSGPDFFNAKIKVGRNVWAGNVELHINAADWYRHHHDKDPAYSTVILHVVLNDDGTRVLRPDGKEVPQTTLSISDEFIHSYAQMVDTPFDALPCSGALMHIPSLYVTDWISALGFERLYQKSDRVLNLLHRFHGDWSETIYVTLARALGFGKNSDAFEMSALSTPLKILLKHRDSLPAVEAILLGQAGFLKNLDGHPDPYVQTLCREYRFMSAKFGLQPLDAGIWKTTGMRPHSFPHRRLATLGMFVHEGFKPGSDIFNVEYADEVRSILRVPVAPYWEQRYTLGSMPTGGAPQLEGLSKSSVDLLIINAVAPIIHARGMQTGDQTMQERAANILASLKAENNAKIQPFIQAGISCRDAFTSQALLQLRKEYCDRRRCLYCRFGHRLLRLSSRL